MRVDIEGTPMNEWACIDMALILGLVFFIIIGGFTYQPKGVNIDSNIMEQLNK